MPILYEFWLNLSNEIFGLLIKSSNEFEIIIDQYNSNKFLLIKYGNIWNSLQKVK